MVEAIEKKWSRNQTLKKVQKFLKKEQSKALKKRLSKFTIDDGAIETSWVLVTAVLKVRTVNMRLPKKKPSERQLHNQHWWSGTTTRLAKKVEEMATNMRNVA